MTTPAEPTPAPAPASGAPVVGTPADPTAGLDPKALLRSRQYISMLVLAALLGIPVSAVAYGFLKLVGVCQQWVFTTLPGDLGLHPVPTWWPIPPTVVAGVVVSLVIRYLPGRGGHEPADGFQAGGTPEPIDVVSVFLAAIATLALGIVLGPEAPLILIGGGLGVLAVRLAARDAPPMAATVMAAAGSFAAISTLLGSPLLGAFLLLEAAGLAGPTLELVLIPGLLAAGVGSLVMIGLDSWTGWGTLSLALPALPQFSHPNGVMFLYALAFGVVAALIGWPIRVGARLLRDVVKPRMLVLTPVVGLAVGLVAILFTHLTGHPYTFVLFSGQDQLSPLINQAADWTVGAVVVLIACKAVAYSLSLSSFRGGPIFPAMFLGGALGVACSHLPGLSLVPSIAMGIGVMAVVMLGLPLTSVLLATLLLGTDGLATMPLVIVGVCVAYVANAFLQPSIDRLTGPAGAPAPTPSG